MKDGLAVFKEPLRHAKERATVNYSKHKHTCKNSPHTVSTHSHTTMIKHSQ